MGSCLQCGGFQLAELAPGYFTCASRDDDGCVCGHRFHSSVRDGITESCSCGTFAIGRCAICRVPVCGDHSALDEARRLCSTHWNDEHSAATKRARVDENRVGDDFNRMLVSFLDVASRSGNPGLKRFRLCPDKGRTSLAFGRGWQILRTRHYAEGSAGTYYLRRDRSVAVVIHTVRYISTGPQKGHYDPDLRRSPGMRSGFKEPIFIQPDERAAKLLQHREEIAASLRVLADKHRLDWAASTMATGV